MYDAIVVGLGPAGGAACYTLASRGFSVIGIDKQTHPRYKSCGGCISPKINGLFDFAISHLVEQIAYGITFTYKYRRSLDIASPLPIGYNVMRDSFDNFIVDKAREAGAEILEGCRITGLRDDRDSVTVKTADGRSLNARFLIGADGASGLIGRSHFGLDPRQAAVSVTAEVPYDFTRSPDIARREHVDFASIPHGYSWIFPKKDHLSIGVAADSLTVGGDIKRYFMELVSKHPILEGVRVNINDSRGWTIPLYYDGVTQTVKGRVVLAGDTGHLVDPFMGEGIYYAACTGKAAAIAVARAVGGGVFALGEYQRWLEEAIFPQLKAAELLANLVYSHPRLWYAILEKEPEIMTRFYNVIRGTESFTDFYAWAIKQVKSKPWKIIRRWLESRLLPA